MPKHYIDVGKKIDLSLFTNYNDVEEMRLHGCKADYLQCGADNTIYTPIGVRTLAPEIVFMGNHYDKQFELSDYRLRMVKFLKKTYGERFCVYGSGWAKELHAQNLMFWQTKEAEIYRSCKIAINCSHINLRKYTSDRFFRILLSGAFCLNKEFPEMEEYGNNFVSFSENFDELKNKIDYYLENETERNEIASRACEYAHNNWTWEHRIKELYELINYYKNVDK
jgi:spore maturation protein CgeB